MNESFNSNAAIRNPAFDRSLVVLATSVHTRPIQCLEDEAQGSTEIVSFVPQIKKNSHVPLIIICKRGNNGSSNLFFL